MLFAGVDANGVQGALSAAAERATELTTCADAAVDAIRAVKLRLRVSLKTRVPTTKATPSTIASGITFQIGADKDEKMTADFTTEMTAVHDKIKAAADQFDGATGAAAAAAGTEISGADATTGATNANATIKDLSDAIDAVGTMRSKLGAVSNRLDHVNSNLSNISTNTKAATGRIMDVDFATESASMTSNQMLLQAGTAMLKQSNSQSSLVMSLLQ